LNAASFLPGPIAPGEIVTIFGSGLETARVLFDGIPAPLIHAAANQISAVVPFAIAGKPSTVLQLENGAQRSDPATAPVAESAPGLFTSTESGGGQGCSRPGWDRPVRPAWTAWCPITSWPVPFFQSRFGSEDWRRRCSMSAQ
jgi:uncharacterized protein (TIGR03437 family)